VLQQLSAMLATPHKLALVQFRSLMQSHTRLQLAWALVESGVTGLLAEPRDFESIREALEPTRPDLLRSLLDLAVGHGLLSKSNGHYRPRGALVRALCHPSGAPLADMLGELCLYHGDVIRRLPDRIRGDPDGDYLAQYGPLVAGSSRIVEPFLRGFAVEAVGRTEPRRVLEIGCGSGIYLRHYADAHPGHHGVAVDLDPKVVGLARANLERWGLSERFEVRSEDIRSPSPHLDGPFDVVTSFQNVYYFTAEERVAWFGAVRERLAAGGVLAIASALHDDRPFGAYFDLVLASTSGCYPLPSIEELETELHEAGFEQVDRRRLLLGEALWGLLAR
jgi:SAM-dependent methyltransferase